MDIHFVLFTGGLYAVLLLAIIFLFLNSGNKKKFSMNELVGTLMFICSLPIGYLFFLSLITLLAIPDIKEWQIWVTCLAINSLVIALASKIKRA